MIKYQIVIQLAVLLAVIALGYVIGVILEKFIYKRLIFVAAHTKWQGDEIIVEAMRGTIRISVTIAAIYLATLNITMSQRLFEFLQKTLLIGVILLVTMFLAKVAANFISAYAKRAEGVLPSTSIFSNLARILVFLLGLLVILQSIGISITPILTALGVGGLAVALALQDTLTNLFSGLHITVSKKVRPGDYIKLDTDEQGYVVDVTWRNTTIRSLDNNMLVVPNSKLASTTIVNYYQPEKEMGVSIEAGVSYDSDLAKVEKVTIEVAKEVMREVPGGIPRFEPFIRYHTFAESGIRFAVALRVKEYTDQSLVKHEFIKRLHERYQKEGIKIPYPARSVYLNGPKE